MIGQLESSLARIYSKEQRIVGAGLLVTNRQLITCVHVIARALGLSDNDPEVPQAEVHLDFPLVTPGRILTSRICLWQPTMDIAGLELVDGPPADVRPTRLVKTEHLWGHTFRTFGFPAGYESGVWASGVLRGRQADGWVQFEDVKQTGYFVQSGFSGAPVWDEELGGVVGIIVAADTTPEVRAAFLIPTGMLVSIWPLVMPKVLPDVKRVHDRLRVVNLPPLDMTHTFKDRLGEIQALYDYLADQRVRLVSVVGRGGWGKTALVCHILADLQQDMLLGLSQEKKRSIDGILYLGARTTGLGLERIYADVGRMLGEPAAGMLTARWTHGDTSPAAKVGYLLEAMQDGQYLILLDNLEDHLTEEGEITDEGLRLFVEHCLLQPGGARLIATSRQQIRLPAAALPRLRTILLAEGLPDDDASALLHELDPQSELGLRDASQENLQHAIRLTQGIPRALELVAGILNHDPTSSLSRLLADERLFGEQVVEQLVAEGYRHLADNERRVIEALAIFDRPVEETAVTYLLYPWFPALNVRACLRHLANSCFVGVNRATSKFSLHPLDRECAYRQLPHGDEKDAYNRRDLELRAADYYASIRKPESEWKTIRDLGPQLAEFEHRVRAADYEGAHYVLELIDYDYLSLWGHNAQMVKMRESLLKRFANPRLEATNLYNLGRSYHPLGKYEHALKFYADALVIAQEIGDRWLEGLNLGHSGRAYWSLGQVERAVELLKEALTIAREFGDRWVAGCWAGDLGSAYRDWGQMEQAIDLYEEELEVAREIGNRWEEEAGLGRLGVVHCAMGQVALGIQYLQRALVITRELGAPWDEGLWISHLGRSHRKLGQFEQATKLHREGLAVARRIGNRAVESYHLLGLGQVLLSTGDVCSALQCCSEALALDEPRSNYIAALALGIVLLQRRDALALDTFIDAAARSHRMLDETAGLYEVRYVLGAALVGQAVCDFHWANESHRTELLAPALAEYRRALDICAAAGVVQDALQDLELIRAAGIEGLESVFDLLNSALVQNVLVEKSVDLLNLAERAVSGVTNDSQRTCKEKKEDENRAE